jgi:hypothetical protein
MGALRATSCSTAVAIITLNVKLIIDFMIGD